MSRKILIALIILIIAIILGGGVWFYFSIKPSEVTVDEFSITDLIPFGNLFTGKNDGETSSDGTSSGGVGDTSEGGSRLTLLAKPPTAGFVAISSTTVRYLERATGHVYDIRFGEKEAKRVSNTTIPRVYEAIFAGGGSRVFIRYLSEDNETIETYSAKIPTTTPVQSEAGELTGVFFPENIKQLAVSPDGKNVFYLTSYSGGGTGIISNLEGLSRNQVFSSQLSEWLVSWPAEKMMLFGTKPSGLASGYLFSFEPSSKKLEKITGGFAGATAIANLGFTNLLLGAGGGAFPLSAFFVKEKTAETLGINTFPEKCVFASSDEAYCAVPKSPRSLLYPDAWYKGEIVFGDSVWKINFAGLSVDLVADISTIAGTPLDATRPSLSPDKKYLIFIDKKNQSLWALELN